MILLLRNINVYFLWVVTVVYFKGALYDVSTSIHFRILIAASEYFCFIASFLYLMFAVLQTEQIR